MAPVRDLLHEQLEKICISLRVPGTDVASVKGDADLRKPGGAALPVVRAYGNRLEAHPALRSTLLPLYREAVHGEPVLPPCLDRILGELIGAVALWVPHIVVRHGEKEVAHLVELVALDHSVLVGIWS